MQAFEYKVVPAPDRGKKAKGVKTTEDRFALALTEKLNEMAAEGWDYVRAETLPCEERKGLTGTVTTEQNVLIFRRRAHGSERVVSTPLSLGEAPAAPTGRREPAVSRPTAPMAEPGA
ncbi:DUF4177 domain-containing protein [Alphaproteobacteria bacterium GH1-50]|uniref:DUF4177 domain-containing protein n=1 Tax=Kangsaoukella pontilimi TaxID=2691042 RepID=A0A7C9IP51_9RHOB|nr:DUF4177 domain-containing protein [Kangsaoukella pontilimi]MXQ06643.1 DUF4177 domain-containing protein [Kangsaoukella pontilimi]